MFMRSVSTKLFLSDLLFSQQLLFVMTKLKLWLWANLIFEFLTEWRPLHLYSSSSSRGSSVWRTSLWEMESYSECQVWIDGCIWQTSSLSFPLLTSASCLDCYLYDWTQDCTVKCDLTAQWAQHFFSCECWCFSHVSKVEGIKWEG